MEQKQLNQDLAKLRENLGLLPEAVANPGFVVVSGLPGTGKTFFCRKMAEKQPFCILRATQYARLYSPLLTTALLKAPEYSPHVTA